MRRNPQDLVVLVDRWRLLHQSNLCRLEVLGVRFRLGDLERLLHQWRQLNPCRLGDLVGQLRLGGNFR